MPFDCNAFRCRENRKKITWFKPNFMRLTKTIRKKKWDCRRILFVFWQNTWTIDFAYLKTKWINKCTKLRSIGIFIGKITTLMDCIQNTQSNAQNELVAVFTAVVVVHFTYDEITLETIWCVKSIKVLWFRFNITDTKKNSTQSKVYACMCFYLCYILHEFRCY